MAAGKRSVPGAQPDASSTNGLLTGYEMRCKVGNLTPLRSRPVLFFFILVFIMQIWRFCLDFPGVCGRIEGRVLV